MLFRCSSAFVLKIKKLCIFTMNIAWFTMILSTAVYGYNRYSCIMPLTTGYSIRSRFLFFSVAELLKVDSKKLSWSFLNYCVVVNGTAVRRKQTISGVYESIRVFAQTLYARLFDWIVNIINLKLSFTRAIL